MKAITIKGSSLEEIEKLLNENSSSTFQPTLAILFMSLKLDCEKVCNLLDAKGIAVFGASTAGEFIDGDIAQGSIVIMLLDMNPAFFKVTFQNTEDSTTYEIAKQIGSEGKNLFTNPAFFIASGGISTDGEKIIAGIEAALGREVTIYGAMAGDDLNLTESFVFSNGKISNNGLVAIIIDEDKISLNGIATCGWKPIGTIRTVTKSEGPVVYTIDNEPALELVIKYLGVKFDLDSRKEVVMNIGAYFPLQLERENAEPVMRTVMFVNKEEHSLICAGNVPQGSKLRFSLPPDFDVIDKVVEECNELKDIYQTQGDAMIMFSCISRQLSFGQMISEEIERVKQVWNCPLIGFFSYGEIGKSKKGKHEFHNNTCCLVVLKEK